MSIAEKLTAVAENVPKVYEAGKNDGYDIVKTEVEAALSNVYTKKESDALLNVHKKWEGSVELSGDDELEGKKTSDYIYLANITPADAVTFGQKHEVTGQYFGYVGVQNIPAGKYLLLADVGVDTDFDLSKVRVSEFYDNGSGMRGTGRKLGTLTNGTANYILCEIDFADGDMKHGFFMEATDGSSPTINFTLNDVRLYKTKDISSITGNEAGLRSFKDDMLSDGVAIKPKEDFKENYIIIVDSDYSHPRICSFDDAKSVEISLYIPLENSFTTKSAFADLTDIVNSKGLIYEDHILPCEHVVLEQGYLYYLRGNTDDMEFNFYDQDGNILKDSGGTKDMPAFDAAMLFTSINTHNGVYKNFAILPKLRTLDVKATDGTVIGTVDVPHFTTRSFDISPDKPQFYVKGTSSTLDLWKIKV